MLKDKWTDKVNGVSEIDASDINLLANEIIETQEKVDEIEENGGGSTDVDIPLAGTPETSNISVVDVATGNGEWISFTDNTIHCASSSGTAALNVKGDVDIEFDSNVLVEVSVDGTLIYYIDFNTMTQVGDKFFNGTVADNIVVKFISGSGTVTFTKFELTTYKDGLMTAEQSKKLDETEVFTAEEKETVHRVGLIKDASSVTTRYRPKELLDVGRLVIDSSVTTIIGNNIKGGTEATINVHGKAKLRVSNLKETTSKVYIDGVLLETSDFEGFVDVITMTDETSLNITFTTLNITEYSGGYMTAEHLETIEMLQMGFESIGLVFDEVHTYAEEVIGGDSE